MDNRHTVIMKKTRRIVTVIIVLSALFWSSVSAQRVIFEDGFESGALDPNFWTAQPGENGGLVEVASSIGDLSTAARNGFFAVAMGRSAEGNLTANALGVEQDEEGAPEHFSPSQNYPNPFNPTTSISYEIPVPGHVRIVFYDALGRYITTLVDSLAPAGRHTVSVDLKGYPSSVYFYRMEAGGFSKTMKMFLVK